MTTPVFRGTTADDLTEARNALQSARHNLDLLWDIARLKHEHRETLDDAVFKVASELASVGICIDALLKDELASDEDDDDDAQAMTVANWPGANGGSSKKNATSESEADDD